MSIIFNSLPVDGPLRITSPFGPRQTSISGASINHMGVDLGRDFAKPKTAILSVAAGTVTNSYYNNVRGWVIIIDHGGFKTLYQHLEAQGAAKGARVKAGQRIGIMGASTSTIKNMSLHLHMELIVAGKQIDVGPYLRDIREEIDMTEERVRQIIQEELAATGKAVSDWAKPFWAEMTATGIVDGTNPQGYTTREQVATMISKIKGGK